MDRPKQPKQLDMLVIPQAHLQVSTGVYKLPNEEQPVRIFEISRHHESWRDYTTVRFRRYDGSEGMQRISADSGETALKVTMP